MEAPSKYFPFGLFFSLSGWAEFSFENIELNGIPSTRFSSELKALHMILVVCTDCARFSLVGHKDYMKSREREVRAQYWASSNNKTLLLHSNYSAVYFSPLTKLWLQPRSLSSSICTNKTTFALSPPPLRSILKVSNISRRQRARIRSLARSELCTTR